MNLKNALIIHKYLILILFANFLSKLTGLTWGFPGTLHNDESNVIRTSLGLRFGDLNPHHFDWPSLYFYINYFVFWAFIKLRTQFQILFGVETMKKLLPFWWGPELPFYLLGRLLANLFVILNIVVVYKLSLKLFSNKKIAILSSLFYSLGYWVTYLSFYALTDSALAFFMLTSLYFSVSIAKSSKLKNYVLAALFAGLATATKYNGALMCLVIPVAHSLREKRIQSIFDKKIVISAIVAITTFFIGTPYALLDWKTFIGTQGASGAFWQIKHVGLGTNWTYHLLESIPQNFGWPFAMISYIGTIILLKHKDPSKRLLSITFLIILVYTGTWGITRAHYTLPMFSLLAISGSLITVKILNFKCFSGKTILKIMLIAILSTPMLVRNAEEIIRRDREDTRLISGKWIDKNIPSGSYIFSDKELTGIFGGDLPLFDYDNYNIRTPSHQIKNTTGTKEYIIVTNKEVSNDKLIYYQDNFLRTGPTISVLRAASDKAD